MTGQGFVGRLHGVEYRVLCLGIENLLHHALPCIRAGVYGFHRRKEDNGEAGPLRVDVNDVISWLVKSETAARYERRLLRNIPRLDLIYEADILEASRHQAAVDEICRYIGVAPGRTKALFRKISPRNLRDSVENYDELAEALRTTRYRVYLE